MLNCVHLIRLLVAFNDHHWSYVSIFAMYWLIDYSVWYLPMIWDGRCKMLNKKFMCLIIKVGYLVMSWAFPPNRFRLRAEDQPNLKSKKYRCTKYKTISTTLTKETYNPIFTSSWRIYIRGSIFLIDIFFH